MRIDQNGTFEHYQQIESNKYRKISEIFSEEELNYGFVGIKSKDNYIFVYGEHQINERVDKILTNEATYPIEIKTAI